MRLAILTLITVVCCGWASAAEPNRLPETKPPSFWSKLLGKRSTPPVARKMRVERPAKSKVTVDANVDRASYEEPEAPVVMPPVQPKRSALSPLTSWLRRPKRPSRTMSEYMSEERP